MDDALVMNNMTGSLGRASRAAFTKLQHDHSTGGPPDQCFAVQRLSTAFFCSMKDDYEGSIAMHAHAQSSGTVLQCLQSPSQRFL